MRVFRHIGALIGLALASSHAHGMDYPAAWWEPFPRDQAYDWEILPQDAGPGEVILSKRNELGIFSNFAATPFELDGVRYASLEGFWQMLKYPEDEADPRATVPGIVWPFTRAKVGDLTGFEAKDAGDVGSKAMKKLDINWVTYRGTRLPYRIPERGAHYQLIVRATWAKLEQNPAVRELLMRTGDLTLKPDHRQGDDTPPAWRYFEIWMEIRQALRAKTAAETAAKGAVKR